jgi:hypothetical protein
MCKAQLVPLVLVPSFLKIRVYANQIVSVIMNLYRQQVLKLFGAPHLGPCWSSWGEGALVLFMRDVYFEVNMGARQNIYFGRHFAWLKYESCFII